MIFDLATLKAKLILGAVVFAVLSAIGGTIWYQSHKIDSLKKDKIELTTEVKNKEATIQETGRREEVVDSVNNEGNKQRVIIEKVYQKRIERINESVQEGSDRPVGPLLNRYFNDGL